MLSGYREQAHGKPIVGRGDAVIRTVVFCPRVSKFGDFAQGRTIPEHGFAGERPIGEILDLPDRESGGGSRSRSSRKRRLRQFKRRNVSGFWQKSAIFTCGRGFRFGTLSAKYTTDKPKRKER